MKKSAVFGIILASTLLSGLVMVKGFEYYNARIFPRTQINNIPVGGLTIEEATVKLNEANLDLPSGNVVVTVDDISVASHSSELGLAYSYEDAARKAYLNGKDGSIVIRFVNILISLFTTENIAVNPNFNPDRIKEMLTQLQLQVDVIGEQPQATLVTSGNPETLTINPGKPGRLLEVEPTIQKMQKNVTKNEYTTTAQVASTSATLSDEQVTAARTRAEKYVGYTINLETDMRTYTLSDQDLITALTFPDGYDKEELELIFEDWEESVNRDPQNAVFEYDPETLEVHEFIPHKKGLELNSREAIWLATSSMREIEEDTLDSTTITHSLPVAETEPEITLAQTNDLGITERIGFGDSEYDHSIPNRVHNVKITTDRVAKTIIPPGAEFSFNQTLGEVSSRTGYRSAYVIKGGRTELGDGGGVCQVSTTVFRAVLDAGLPVTLRLPHSYRVSYYEQDSKPGIDATVYSGNIDLRFVNDTGNHILMFGEADSNDLYMYMEIYGTSDGRTTEIVDHEVWGYQPPPPAQEFEDPSKPAGYREQVDWAAAGIKARFTNVVKDKDGNIIREDEYASSYRPWAAKFVVGTGEI